MTSFGKGYFQECYGDYFRQNPPSKLKGYLDLLRSYLGGGRLLDIGCSYGTFLEQASAYFSCTGMDVDPEVVAEAAKRVPLASFVVGKLPDIPFKGMDAVTLLDVVEHVPDVERTMEAVWGALRPGGIVLMVVPVYDGPLGCLVGKLDKDPTHIHRLSRRFWLELTSRHFELLEWRGSFRKLFFGRFYLHIGTKLLRGIAPAVMMVLRRPEQRVAPGVEET